MIKGKTTIPINTLDEALRSAEILVRDLSNPQSQAYQRYRIFSALTSDDREGLIAFLIWRARGEMLQKLVRSGLATILLGSSDQLFTSGRYDP